MLSRAATLSKKRRIDIKEKYQCDMSNDLILTNLTCARIVFVNAQTNLISAKRNIVDTRTTFEDAQKNLIELN